jgi:DNA-binding PadR family transcriptional regulator
MLAVLFARVLDTSVLDTIMSELSPTEGAVLGLLAFGERSGYELAYLAEHTVGYLWTPSRRHIYKVLHRLAAAGLAEGREVEQRGRPDKHLFSITEHGREALRVWLDEVEDEPAAGRVVFPLKLFFGDFASPDAAQRQLTAYRRYLERRVAAYENVPGDIELRGRFPERVRAHGLARARATLTWVDETARAVEATASAVSD